jgi:hypothetical protein
MKKVFLSTVTPREAFGWRQLFGYETRIYKIQEGFFVLRYGESVEIPRDVLCVDTIEEAIAIDTSIHFEHVEQMITDSFENGRDAEYRSRMQSFDWEDAAREYHQYLSAKGI